MKFYAYMWLRKDGTPFYVGKGCGDRAIRPRRGCIKRPSNPERILIFPRASEEEAFLTEIELIANWGRKDLETGCLRNLTPGGEQPPRQKGIPRSIETRHKMSHSARKPKPWLVGRKQTPESIAKRVALNTGKKRTPEQKEIIRRAALNQWSNPDLRAKMVAGMLGKSHAPSR